MAIYESSFETNDFNYRLELSFEFEVSDDRLKIHLSLLHAAGHAVIIPEEKRFLDHVTFFFFCAIMDNQSPQNKIEKNSER